MSHELQLITDRLIEALPSSRLTILGRMWDEQAFGSGLIELGRDAIELRVVWDGKDGWAYLQKVTPDGRWEDIAGPIKESDFGFGQLNQDKVLEFASAAKRALGETQE